MYYELKLCAIILLFPPFKGADLVYTMVHKLFRKLRHSKYLRFFFRHAISAIYGDMTDDDFNTWLGKTPKQSAVAFTKQVARECNDRNSSETLVTLARGKLRDAGTLDKIMAKGRLGGVKLERRAGLGRLYSRAASHNCMPGFAELETWTKGQLEAALGLSLDDVGETGQGDLIKLKETDAARFEQVRRLNGLIHLGLEEAHAQIIESVRTMMNDELHRLVRQVRIAARRMPSVFPENAHCVSTCATHNDSLVRLLPSRVPLFAPPFCRVGGRHLTIM